MKRKLLFFDIDGTLLDHDKSLPASTKQALRQLKEAGHTLAIATGRGPFMFKELREELGIDSFVSYNGQYVECNGKAIYTNPIPHELVRQVTDLAISNDHPIVFMNHETMKSNVEYHVYVKESIDTLKVAHPEYEPEFFMGRDLYQCLLFCPEQEEGMYRERFSEGLNFIRWHPYSTDVLPLGGSKAQGIEKMIEYIGADPTDVYAFGDNINDLEMLQFVHHSVAMGNAPDHVKKAARYVTRAVDDDGIFHGLQMLKLL